MNSKQINATVNRLISFMGDVKDGNLRAILANLQTMCEYQAEKLRIYEEHLTALAGKARPDLNESDKRRLAQKGKALNDYLLAAVEPTWAPGTLRHWYNTLVGAKYDSTKKPNQKKRGRKPISKEIVDKALLLSQRNPDWGYDRIAGTMKYLGYDVCASTIKHILDDGIVPDPERRKRGDWSQFIETQQHVTAATDFAQVEILTPYGLVRESLLFFMGIGTREVRCGGIVHAPDGNWTMQIARNMGNMGDGFLPARNT